MSRRREERLVSLFKATEQWWMHHTRQWFVLALCCCVYLRNPTVRKASHVIYSERGKDDFAVCASMTRNNLIPFDVKKTAFRKRRRLFRMYRLEKKTKASAPDSRRQAIIEAYRISDFK
ncbi:hypothetical protein CEXT_82571 [Caerostris extrusa]|uniref:Uncharacterized protein n=1 Tax=Caerostris extrusa TaxID=172846 RepID=A0AAV4M735_CAEEX|nr:hypothetical protein CEXT_82571 [Caerostris extrusa]